MLNRSPGFRQFVFSAFATRLQSMMVLLQQVALVRVENRLVRVLLAQANEQGTVVATHQELATKVGTAREVVSRRLDAFARRGLLNLERGSLTIKDRACLKKISESQ